MTTQAPWRSAHELAQILKRHPHTKRVLEDTEDLAQAALDLCWELDEDAPIRFPAVITDATQKDFWQHVGQEATKIKTTGRDLSNDLAASLANLERGLEWSREVSRARAWWFAKSGNNQVPQLVHPDDLPSDWDLFITREFKS